MAYCFIERHVNVPGTVWCKCGSLVAGTPIDGYNVISYLGHGTSGDVYLAEQPALNNRKLVIKIAHRTWNQSDIDNFRREAALLASLSHPYILPIYAYGVIYEGKSTDFTYSPYLVLPYASDGSLEDAFLRSGKRPWPLRSVVSMAQEVAEALDYAHSRGVLHRDVKPANLLSMGSHVLLSDFSVASLIDVDVSHVNAPWAGSPAYMAPEVWRRNPGRYSDQYALAVTCFRLLTGEYPWAKMSEGKRAFQPADRGLHRPPDAAAVGAEAPLQADLQESPVQAWLHLHCNVPPTSLQTYRPNLPGAVDLVLQMGMAKDPHERYVSVQAFAADLLDASEDRTQALNKSIREVAKELKRASTELPLTGPPLRPLPLDAQTAGKEWKNAIGSGAILPLNAPIPGLEVSQTSVSTDNPFPSRSILTLISEESGPATVAVESVTKDIQENQDPSTERISLSSGPSPLYQPSVGSDESPTTPIHQPYVETTTFSTLSGGQGLPIEPADAKSVILSNSEGSRRESAVGGSHFKGTQQESDRNPYRATTQRWLWYTLLFNGLIAVLLAAEAYWQSKDMLAGASLLLGLWPSLLIGPLVTRGFRWMRLSTFPWAICWGVFFGMTNVLLSSIVCYVWVGLGRTFLQWGNGWHQVSDGVPFFVSQIVGLAQPALTPLLLSLWLSVLGGALLGIALYRNERHQPIQLQWQN